MSWQEQAACRSDPDLWFSPDVRAAAMHICRTHCPVLEECRSAAGSVPPRDGVQAGVAFTIHGRPAGKPKPATTCQTCAAASKKISAASRCGTDAGYRWHLRHGERSCQSCRTAANKRRREFAAKAREAAA